MNNILVKEIARMQEQSVQPQPPYSAPPQMNPKKSKKQLTWALICLLGPTVLIVLSLLIYAVANFFVSAGSTPTADGDLFGEPPLFKTIANVILFVVGGIATLTWLPGIIVGIVLLATRK